MSRGHGTGTVYPTEDGRFRARMPGEHRTSLGIFPTELEADAAIRTSLAVVAARGARLGETFATFGVRVLDMREEDGVRSVDSERRRFALHLERSELGGRPVAEIRPVEVSDWVRALCRKNAADKRGKRKLSRKTVARCLSLASVIFDMAVERELRPDNPCKGVRIRGAAASGKNADPEDVDEVWDWLRVEEQRAIKECAEIPEWGRLFLQFAWGTGLRQGEQWNLELRDLHVEGPRPYVFVRFGSKGKRPKNGKTRKVRLFGDGLAAAKRWLEIRDEFLARGRELAAKKGERLPCPELVFPTPRGCRRGVGAPDRTTWDPVTKKQGKEDLLPIWLKLAGVTRDLRWHDLRHTCASSLVSGAWGRRWTLEQVKEHLGHSSILVTQIYAHLAESDMDHVADQTGHERATAGGTTAVGLNVFPNDSGVVGRPGLEPGTYGLKVPPTAEQLRALASDPGRFVAAYELLERLHRITRAEVA